MTTPHSDNVTHLSHQFAVHHGVSGDFLGMAAEIDASLRSGDTDHTGKLLCDYYEIMLQMDDAGHLSDDDTGTNSNYWIMQLSHLTQRSPETAIMTAYTCAEMLRGMGEGSIQPALFINATGGLLATVSYAVNQDMPFDDRMMASLDLVLNLTADQRDIQKCSDIHDQSFLLWRRGFETRPAQFQYAALECMRTLVRDYPSVARAIHDFVDSYKSATSQLSMTLRPSFAANDPKAFAPTGMGDFVVAQMGLESPVAEIAVQVEMQLRQHDNTAIKDSLLALFMQIASADDNEFEIVEIDKDDVLAYVHPEHTARFYWLDSAIKLLARDPRAAYQLAADCTKEFERNCIFDGDMQWRVYRLLADSLDRISSEADHVKRIMPSECADMISVLGQAMIGADHAGDMDGMGDMYDRLQARYLENIRHLAPVTRLEMIEGLVAAQDMYKAPLSRIDDFLALIRVHSRIEHNGLERGLIFNDEQVIDIPVPLSSEHISLPPRLHLVKD